jgi:SAM-dependent methyltransferase
VSAWDEDWYCRYYDELFPYDEDLNFYQSRLDAGSAVLEIGAGSGRVSRPLALSGHKVLALDSSEAMTARGRNALGGDAVRWVVADVFSFAGNQAQGKFDAVVMALNTINEFSPDQRASLFPEIAGLLRPGGQLLLQTFIPNEHYFSSMNPSGVGGSAWENHGRQSMADGSIVDTSISVRYDRVSQALHATFRFTESAGDGRVLIERVASTLTYALYPGELKACLTLSGFDEHALWGDFNSGGLRAETGDVIVRAHKTPR